MSASFVSRPLDPLFGTFARGSNALAPVACRAGDMAAQGSGAEEARAIPSLCSISARVTDDARAPRLNIPKHPLD
jgi:hypothetical protein